MGKVQIWYDGQPRSDTPGGDYVPERNAMLRDMVRTEMDDPANACIVAPTFAAMGTYPDSLAPSAGALRADNLHNSHSGAHRVAWAIMTAARSLLSSFDPLSRPGILADLDTGFVGGGANVAPSSGGAAGGTWSVAVISSGISWQMVTDEYGIRWIEFDVAGITGATITMTGPTHASLVGAGKPLVPGSRRVEGSVLWRIGEGHGNARMARCQLYDSGGQTLPYDMPASTPAAGGARPAQRSTRPTKAAQVR